MYFTKIKNKIKILNNSKKCPNHNCLIMWYFCSSVISAGSHSALFLVCSVIFHYVLVIVPEKITDGDTLRTSTKMYPSREGLSLLLPGT